MANLDSDKLVAVHNAYCHQNRYEEEIIYPLNAEMLNELFSNAGDFYNAVKKADIFYPKAPYFVYHNGKISTDFRGIINLYALAEYLIDWGDSSFDFDMTEYLEKSFTDMVVAEYEREGNFSREEIERELAEMDNDYLMENWDELSRELWQHLLCHR